MRKLAMAGLVVLAFFLGSAHAAVPHRVVVRNTVTLGPGETTAFPATCPRGMDAVGGGYATNYDPQVYILESQPSYAPGNAYERRAWQIEAKNLDATDSAVVKAYAVCLER